MKFFRIPGTHLPQNFSSESINYIRASFGLVAAVTTTINPIVGALIITSQVAWEVAGLLAQTEAPTPNPVQSAQPVGIPTATQEERRHQAYSDAFIKLLAKARDAGSQCSPEEVENSRRIFFIHNLIEEVCYKAFAEKVAELGIKGDKITLEQSDQILAYIKKIAHVELRKPGGYSLSGRTMITSEQFSQVLANVASIVHDRDVRLTDARYFSLADLCVALDDHNSYVKNTLFSSWFKCPKKMSCDTHLDIIKNQVEFNTKMSNQLNLDFENAVLARKKYYDTHHPGIRVVKSEAGELSADKFTNLTEVRAKFESVIATLSVTKADIHLISYLKSNKVFAERDIDALFKERCYSCSPRFHAQITQRPLLAPAITVGDFLQEYFPEVVVHSSSQSYKV